MLSKFYIEEHFIKFPQITPQIGFIFDRGQKTIIQRTIRGKVRVTNQFFCDCLLIVYPKKLIYFNDQENCDFFCWNFLIKWMGSWNLFTNFLWIIWSIHPIILYGFYYSIKPNIIKVIISIICKRKMCMLRILKVFFSMRKNNVENDSDLLN